MGVLLAALGDRATDRNAVRPVDPESFGEWVPVMARLASRLAPYAERDDIVQEALSRAWQKRGQYDAARGTPSAWLLAITADQARKASRRRSRPIRLAWPAEAAGPDEHLELEQAPLARLSSRQRLAIDCFYFVGLSVAETAAVMGAREGTVKSTLADGRALLRRLLEVAK